jgi:hypothetical protein
MSYAAPGGDPVTATRIPAGITLDDRICSFPGCGEPRKARGYCKKHWRRWRKHGDPAVVAAGGNKLGERRRPLAERFWAKVDKNGPVPAHRPELGPCWPWTGALFDTGYGCFRLDARHSTGAHRVSYLLAHGEIPEGAYILHHCDNKPCVRSEHIYAGTAADNYRDTVARHPNGDQPLRGIRRHLFGEASPQARLTEAQVREIRRSSASSAVLARQYGVSGKAIWEARTGRTWGHLQ